MARPKKTTTKAKKNAELAPTSDPRAPLDGAAFLKAAQRVLRVLADDLANRATTSSAVTATLKARHAAEVDARRTADAFVLWQQSFVEQVAAAWLLSCVFTRVLEDRGLLGRARIAGPGATDSQHLFLELAPSLTERDYLLTVFRELSRFAAARDLFDARHNPVWLLAPSAEVTKELLALFRTPNANEPAFRFGASDTRFLGDLYQDLSEDVKKRFALLQTPRFVESFILDRTLERAIERFGLNETTLIDPTCGSGHFLLGAFERLFDHRLRAEPGLEPREAARKALDAVFGADINPYAVAIARFRLTLAYLEKAGFTRLKDAPALPLHLVVADSLLHNPQARGITTVGAQRTFGEVSGQSRANWDSDLYQLEDEAAAQEVLHRQYAAVVGNPPYITPKDSARAGQYQAGYASAFRKYSLAVPFTERFFQLSRTGGSVGMITANSFMKREFGKKLIEDYLPTVNLDLVVNTSGAYIPGHGTPTVLLFGTAEPALGKTVHAVLASRGEPSTPELPQQGLVWRSIADHWSEAGFENEYISVMEVERASLAKHPWSLGGGGAAELKGTAREERAEKRLADLVLNIGVDTITRAADLLELPVDAHLRLGVEPEVLLPYLLGEEIRDWGHTAAASIPVPYSRTSWELQDLKQWPGLARFLWPHRSWLALRFVSGGTRMCDVGLPHWAIPQLPAHKHFAPLSITFAFVATHNHFVLDRGGKVFKQSAPIIKLPESATEDDHYALLAYLNSSTACFWMKQVCMNKGGSGIGRGIQDEDWESRFEYDGTKLGSAPLPHGWQSLARLGMELSTLALRRAEVEPEAVIAAPSEGSTLSARIETARRQEEHFVNEMVAAQERLDFEVYRLFGLVDAVPEFEATIQPGSRRFEVELATDGTPTAWFARHNYRLPDAQAAPIPEVADEVRIIETPTFKRRWLLTDWEPRIEQARRSTLLGHVEAWSAGQEPPRIEQGRLMARYVARGNTAAEPILPEGEDVTLASWLPDEAVPFLAALRFTDSGLAKHAVWEETWALQRHEDAGENVGAIPVPPKYDQQGLPRRALLAPPRQARRAEGALHLLPRLRERRRPRARLRLGRLEPPPARPSPRRPLPRSQAARGLGQGPPDSDACRPARAHPLDQAVAQRAEPRVRRPPPRRLLPELPRRRMPGARADGRGAEGLETGAEGKSCARHEEGQGGRS
ncbi:MAG: BREX-2 system adenine-specific DNA-methyltransferase PglX [Myxococcales bacterium]|nr:BREX-2 system adenine-specific DNA-methyltransferase PglX [Myxococcales bacterium]